MLEAATIDVRLTIDSLHFNQTEFRHVNTNLVLQDGKVDIDPFDANLSKGKVRGYARAERVESGASIKGRLQVSGLMPADLGQKNTGLIDGGSIDLLVAPGPRLVRSMSSVGTACGKIFATLPESSPEQEAALETGNKQS